MSEIPEDICETAYELAFVWAMPDEAALTRCTDAIARAILTERKSQAARIKELETALEELLAIKDYTEPRVAAAAWLSAKAALNSAAPERMTR